MVSTNFCRTTLVLLVACFWLLHTSCSKDNLREKAEEQTASFTRLWHPLDGIPTSEMSQGTLEFYRKTLLMRSRLIMTFTSSTFSGPNPMMQYIFASNRPDFVMKFSINNQPSFGLRSVDPIPWGFTERGLVPGAHNLVQMFIDDEQVGLFSGRVPRRLIITPSKSTGKPYSQFAPIAPLSFSWQPDPLHEPNQLMLRISYYSFASSIPSQTILIPDNGFFVALQVLDTTSSPFVVFEFLRFGGDLINLREGIFVEFTSSSQHEVQLKPDYIINRSDKFFPYPLDSLLELNNP